MQCMQRLNANATVMSKNWLLAWQEREIPVFSVGTSAYPAGAGSFAVILVRG